MDYFLLLFSLLGYFLGSISFAIILSRLHGVDIRSEGSGNPGATNVKRVLGSKVGNIVFFLDFLKGLLATLAPLVLFKYTEATPYMIGAFVGALIGHCFPIFHKFSGGKGVATSVGGLVILLPFPLLFGALVWYLAFVYSRIVAVASLALALSLPISSYFLYGIGLKTYFAGALCLFLFYSHRTNVLRLFSGKENKFTK